MQLFETRVKVERMQTSGTNKKVTEIYVVDATSVTEAEAITTQEVAPSVQGEYQLISAKEVKYTEIFGSEAEKYYQAKVIFITLDEKTGAEKKNASLMLINANSFDEALATFKDGMKGTISDWFLAELKETAIIDLFKHNSDDSI